MDTAQSTYGKIGIVGNKKRRTGFTIVELLIVIVVIAILAAITIVAYNGIQEQTKNTKTVNAVAAWVKALQLYKADNGVFPDADTCLGTTTTYDGNGRCWDSSTWTVKSTFLDTMATYLSQYPEPDTSLIDSVNYPYRRGAFYQSHSSGVFYIWVSLLGSPSCPAIAGLNYNTQGSGTEGKYCRYIIE